MCCYHNVDLGFIILQSRAKNYVSYLHICQFITIYE